MVRRLVIADSLTGELEPDALEERVDAKLGVVPQTAAEWVAENPVVALNTLGYETDTGLYKMGDGVSLWNDLPYFMGGSDGVFDGGGPSDSPGLIIDGGTL